MQSNEFFEYISKGLLKVYQPKAYSEPYEASRWNVLQKYALS